MPSEVQYRNPDIALNPDNTAIPKGDSAGRTIVTSEAGAPVIVDVAELPPAANPADAEANDIATTNIRSRSFGFNGATWDRLRSSLSAVTSTITGYLASIPFAKYNAARTIRADGQVGPHEANARGDIAVQEQYLPDFEDNANDVAWVQQRALAVSTGAWANYSSGGTLVGTAGLNIKNAPGRLRGIGGVNYSGATKVYLLVVNKASAPVANDLAVASIPLDTSGNFAGSGNSIDFGAHGIYLSTGISVCLSILPQKVDLTGIADAAYIWGLYL